MFIINPLDVVLVADKPNQEEPLALQPEQTIEVTAFLFSGNQAIPTQKLQNLTNPYLNRALSQNDLDNIKNRIKMLYKAKGLSQIEVTIHTSKEKGSVMIVITENKKKEKVSPSS